ncbi:MAG: FtsX-like permease family protein [Acidimicrobiales bacterium]
MLLIALVSVGGFTVLAQRRLRAIGMLESTGATDSHVRLVVRANGTVVGLVGALAGFVLGLVVWLAYRPSLEQSAHHVIGVFALPGSSSPQRWCSRSSRPSSPLPDPRRRSPGCRSSPPSRAGRPRPARSTARRSPASSAWSGPSCSSATRAARTVGTGAAVRLNWCSASCSSSPVSSCSRRSSSHSRRALPGEHRSRPDWRFATLPATGPARGRRSRRSALASSPLSSSCSPPRPAMGTCSTTRDQTLPPTSSPSTPACRLRRERRLSDPTGGAPSKKVRRPRLLPRCCSSLQDTPGR